MAGTRERLAAEFIPPVGIGAAHYGNVFQVPIGDDLPVVGQIQNVAHAGDGFGPAWMRPGRQTPEPTLVIANRPGLTRGDRANVLEQGSRTTTKATEGATRAADMLCVAGCS